MESLHSMVQRCVATHTDQVAVIFDDGKDVVILTYGEMWKRTVLICKVLQFHGVSKQIVGMCIPPSQDLPSTFLGVLCTSSAVYPFETDGLGFTKTSIQKMHISFLLLHISILMELETLIGLLGGKILQSMELMEFGLVLVHLTNIDVRKNPVELAYCMTTSGTTAEPKIVRVPHSCIVPNIKHIRCLFEVTSEDMTLLTSPLTFDPSMIDLFVTLSSGATLLIVPNAVKLSPQQLTSVISKQHKVSILQVTPALLYRFSVSELRNSLLSATSNLRVLAVGGEKFPALSAVRMWRDENNKTKLYNLYGITELSCWATIQQVTPLLLEEGSEDVPLGQSLCETAIQVLDARGQIVQEGEGEMFIGSSTRHCYVDDEEVLEEAGQVLHWRQTGDLVRIRADGSVFYLHRVDHQIKRNGKRLNTNVIQEVILSKLGEVNDCRVVEVDSELVVFVCCDEGSNDTSATSTREVNDTSATSTREVNDTSATSTREVNDTSATSTREVNDTSATSTREVNDTSATSTREVNDTSATSTREVNDTSATSTREVNDTSATSTREVNDTSATSTREVNDTSATSTREVNDTSATSTREVNDTSATSTREVNDTSATSTREVNDTSATSTREVNDTSATSTREVNDTSATSTREVNDTSATSTREVNDTSATSTREVNDTSATSTREVNDTSATSTREVNDTSATSTREVNDTSATSTREVNDTSATSTREVNDTSATSTREVNDTSATSTREVNDTSATSTREVNDTSATSTREVNDTSATSTREVNDTSATSTREVNDTSATSTREVLQCVKKALPRHYWPDRVCLLHSLPLTKHGKTDVKALMQVARQSPHQLSDLPVEEDLPRWAQRLWKDFLSPDNRTGIDVESCDNFIKLGGDSFSAVQLTNTVERRFHTRLPLLLETVLNKTFSEFVSCLNITYSHSVFGDTQQGKNAAMVKVGNDETIQVTNGETIQVTNGETIQVTNGRCDILTNKNVLSTNVKYKSSSVTRKTHHNESLVETEEERGVVNDIEEREHTIINSDNSVVVNDIEEREHTIINSDNSVVVNYIEEREHTIINSDNSVVVNYIEEREHTIINSDNFVVVNDIEEREHTIIKSDNFGVINDVGNLFPPHIYHNTKSAMLCVQKRKRKLCDTGGQNMRWIGYKSKGNRTQSLFKDFVCCDCINQKKSGSEFHVELSWKHDTGKCVDASPLIALDRGGKHVVLMGSHSHAFSAVQVTSGHVMWRTELADRVESSACLSVCGRWVAVGCYDGCLYVLSVCTGEIKWKFQTGGPIKSSPTADRETSLIIFGSHDQHLFAVDIQKEVCVWKCYLGGGSIFSSPALDEQQRIACVGTLAGNLVAVSIDSGQVHWTYDCGKPVFSSPVIVSGGVVVGCVDGQVHCVSDTGQQNWTFRTRAPVFSSPAVYKHHNSSCLLVGSHDKHLYCLTEHGELVWQFKADSAVYSTPTVLGCPQHNMKQTQSTQQDVDDTSSSKTQRSKQMDCNNTKLCKNDTHNAIKLCKQNISHYNTSQTLTETFETINYKTNVASVSESINCKTYCFNSESPCSGDLDTKCSHASPQQNCFSHTLESSACSGDLETKCSIAYPQQDCFSHTLESSACSGDLDTKCSIAYPQQDCFSHTLESSDCLTSEGRDNIDSVHSLTPVACFASTTGCLYFLDMSSGKCLTKVQLEGEVFSSPVSVDQYVVIGCRDNNIYCFKFL